MGFSLSKSSKHPNTLEVIKLPKSKSGNERIVYLRLYVLINAKQNIPKAPSKSKHPHDVQNESKRRNSNMQVLNLNHSPKGNEQSPIPHPHDASPHP